MAKGRFAIEREGDDISAAAEHAFVLRRCPNGAIASDTLADRKTGRRAAVQSSNPDIRWSPPCLTPPLNR